MATKEETKQDKKENKSKDGCYVPGHLFSTQCLGIRVGSVWLKVFRWSPLVSVRFKSSGLFVAKIWECSLESASVYLGHPPNIRQNHPSHHPPCATTSRASSAKSSPPGQAILRIIPPAQNHPLNHPPCPEPSSESSPLPRTILRIIPPAQNHPQSHPPCPEPSPESSPLPKTIP